MTEVEKIARGQDCPHTVTQGRGGRSWCIECGEQVYDVDERQCGDCQHFFRSYNYSGCRRHLMAVLPTMKVTFKISEGTCWQEQSQ